MMVILCWDLRIYTSSCQGHPLAVNILLNYELLLSEAAVLYEGNYTESSLRYLHLRCNRSTHNRQKYNKKRWQQSKHA